MFNPRWVNSEADISQATILRKIAIYLKVQKRSSSLIKWFEETSGYCGGYSILCGYAMWLELHRPHFHGRERDDWATIKKILMSISLWDETEQTLIHSPQLIANFERMIALLEFLQNPALYLLPSNHQFELNIQDTINRKFEREYSLAGLFKAKDFLKAIKIHNAKKIKKTTTLIQQLCHEDKMVFICSGIHQSVLIKHDKQFFYFSTNQKKGWMVFSENDSFFLIANIFAAHEAGLNQIISLFFYVVKASTQPNTFYPPQHELFSALDYQYRIFSQHEYIQTGLGIAAFAGCEQSILYHLNHAPLVLKEYVNLQDSEGRTALSYAAANGLLDTVHQLLKLGAAPNICDNENTSPLSYALARKHFAVGKLLLMNGADPTRMNDLGRTALSWAQLYNDSRMLALLQSQALFFKPGLDKRKRVCSAEDRKVKVKFI